MVGVTHQRSGSLLFPAEFRAFKTSEFRTSVGKLHSGDIRLQTIKRLDFVQTLQSPTRTSKSIHNVSRRARFVLRGPDPRRRRC